VKERKTTGSRARVTTVASLGVAAVLALAGCGGGGASGTGAAKRHLSIGLTDAGCSPAELKASPGRVTFDVRNAGTGKVTELELKNERGIILAERENIVAGQDGSFTLDLDPGRYVISCPNGAAENNGTLVVEGDAKARRAPRDPMLVQAASQYGVFVQRHADALLAGTHMFAAALRAGDLARAKSLFGPVRYHYELIEPVAESFGGLDPAIDARADDVADRSRWTGFHRIEQILWGQRTTRGTEPYATKLLRDVRTLDRRVRTSGFQPAQMANGTAELLGEASSSKLAGEEDRYSHTDLSDLEGNVVGARVAFELLRPALEQGGHEALTRRVARRFDDVQHGLDAYARNTPLGFAPYGALTRHDRERLSRRLGELAEDLSTVAARVSR